MKENYILPQKFELKQIKISDITFPTPDLKNIAESKAVVIGKWIIRWIESGLSDKSLAVKNLLPSKADFAYFLGVSVGTMQNAFRYAEDLGYLESKQCIGTMIKDKNCADGGLRKLTSKRETAINEIKKYIINTKFKAGENLPPSRTVALLIGCSANTTRLALEYLCAEGILEHKFKNSRESGWKVISTDFDRETIKSVEQKTLVEKVTSDLKEYINDNYKIGSKIPSHSELSKILKASIKTVHDALAVLIQDGILLPHRGRYGTTVIKMPYDTSKNDKKERSIFAPAQDTAFYYYEKTQNRIKDMIAKNYEPGDRFPSILELAKTLDLSPNTVRKAYQNLAKEGYLAFSRGRYGGTFVVDIPETGEETFKWLAVNPQYAEVYNIGKNKN